MAAHQGTATLTNMDMLFNALLACRTIADFVAVYESENFQHSLGRLASWMARKPNDTSVEHWARQWAIGVASGDPDDFALNLDRKACLQLLYSVCDRWRPKGTETATVKQSDIVDVLKDRRIDNILAHCLVMDRAQSLHGMRLPGASGAGMHWYAEKHMGDEGWKERVSGYEGRHTMNKRLLWLIEDLDDELGLNRGALKRWIQPELVPAH